MTAYSYRCTACDDTTEADHPMGNQPRVIRCHCGRPARQILGAGLYIAAAARPTTKNHIVDIDRRDNQFDRDAAAYRRMRHRGLQPEHVDGSARLEDHVGDQQDIDYAPALDIAKKTGRPKDVVLEAAAAIGPQP